MIIQNSIQKPWSLENPISSLQTRRSHAVAGFSPCAFLSFSGSFPLVFSKPLRKFIPSGSSSSSSSKLMGGLFLPPSTAPPPPPDVEGFWSSIVALSTVLPPTADETSFPAWLSSSFPPNCSFFFAPLAEVGPAVEVFFFLVPSSSELRRSSRSPKSSSSSSLTGLVDAGLAFLEFRVLEERFCRLIKPSPFSLGVVLLVDCCCCCDCCLFRPMPKMASSISSRSGDLERARASFVFSSLSFVFCSLARFLTADDRPTSGSAPRDGRETTGDEDWADFLSPNKPKSEGKGGAWEYGR